MEMTPKRITLRYVVPRAFALQPFEVLCPVCSAENRVHRNPRLINQDGDGLFRCVTCRQQFLYNPFVDKVKEVPLAQKAPTTEDFVDLLCRGVNDGEG